MSAAGSATPVVGDGPIGRSAIWAQLLDYLDRDTGAVVLLTGEPGSGRSHVLRKFGERASERGLRALGCRDPLSIERTTKAADVVRVFAAIAGVAEEPASLTRPVKVSSSLVNRVRSIGDLRAHERDVFAMIDEVAPCVIGIDGYDPSPGIDTWFVTRLAQRIREAKTGTILLITGRVDPLSNLKKRANATIDLGPLDRGEVVGYLRQAGARLDPAIDEVEADALYTAIANDARVFRSLTTVLNALGTES